MPAWLFFFIILALQCAYSAPSVAGKVLYLGYTQKYGMDAEEHEYFRKLALLSRPKDELIWITSPTQLENASEKELSDYFRKQILKLNLSDYTIDTLILATHGNTSYLKELSGTQLHGMGDFTESFTDETFENTFSTLKWKLTPEARVVMNSCSTFMGTAEQIERRALMFMKYFGVTDGTIYGATTLEYPYRYRKKFLLRKVLAEMKGKLIEFVNGKAASQIELSKNENGIFIYGFDTQPCNLLLNPKP